jgi:hypothetical protein
VGDSGGVLDLPEAGERVDGVQGVTASSYAWSASTIASCGDAGGWLETVVTSAMVGGVDSLQK